MVSAREQCQELVPFMAGAEGGVENNNAPS
jgi:hypothetical protein